MKDLLVKLEHLLAGAKPRPAGKVGNGSVEDFLGFRKGTCRNRMGEAMCAISEHCRPDMGKALRLLEELAERGNLDARTLLHLAFLHGTIAEAMRQHGRMREQYIPDLLEAIGMGHLKVEFTDEGFTVDGLSAADLAGGGKAVNWN
jgi:hypothetical protein